MRKWSKPTEMCEGWLMPPHCCVAFVTCTLQCIGKCFRQHSFDHSNENPISYFQSAERCVTKDEW